MKNSRRMLLGVLFATVALFFVAGTALAQEAPKPASAKPEPYAVPGGKVYAKKGYGFVKTGSATAVVKKKGGEVTGSFKCACTGSGACNLTTEGKTMSCETSDTNLCIDCRLTVVVKPAPASPTMAKPPPVQLPPGTYIKRPPVKEGVKRRAP